MPATDISKRGPSDYAAPSGGSSRAAGVVRAVAASDARCVGGLGGAEMVSQRQHGGQIPRTGGNYGTTWGLSRWGQ